MTAAALAVVLFTHCQQRSERPAQLEHIPVFVISVDTLRSDHLPAYGYRSGATPAIDLLRSDSVLFTRAFSACPLTLPSHISIFTGRFPPQHGVRDNLGYRLAPDAATIASVLRSRGYSTGAAVSTYVLRRETGASVGFDFYDDAMTVAPAGAETSATRPGVDTERLLENWVESQTSRDVFAFLHLYEPHAPYDAPAEFATGHSPYDAEIAYADSIVGRFVSFLKRRNLYDDAIVVFLSDHGEGLGDHGEAEHGIFLYREALQVPFMIKLPRGARAGTTIDTPASLVDVWPTIAALLGAPVDSAGRDLLRPPPPQARSLYAESYFGRLHFGWHEQRAAIDERFHFIESARSELFDYRSDAAERRNILGESRRTAAALRASLPPPSFTRPSPVSDEQRRVFQSLGYISSTGSSSGPLPDPKDQIATLRLYDEALAELKQGQPAAAEVNLLRFTRANPGMSDGWVALAQSQRSKGDRKAAIASLQTAMTRFPENPIVVLNLAATLYEDGQKDAARRHVALILESDPVPAGELLARMAEDGGDRDEAQRVAAEVLTRDPQSETALMILARGRLARKDFAGALEMLDRVLESSRSRKSVPPRGANLQRATVLLNLLRGPEADAALVAETRDHPDNLEAWANLAVVRESQGRRDEARQILITAIRQNPGPASVRMARETLLASHDGEGIQIIERASGRQ